jgi:hypothetical protein
MGYGGRQEEEEDRQRRMDRLEREMAELRERMQRTLDGPEGRGRRPKVLERFLGILPDVPRRSPGRRSGSGEDAPESPEPRPTTPSSAPPETSEGGA